MSLIQYVQTISQHHMLLKDHLDRGHCIYLKSSIQHIFTKWICNLIYEHINHFIFTSTNQWYFFRTLKKFRSLKYYLFFPLKRHKQIQKFIGQPIREICYDYLFFNFLLLHVVFHKFPISCHSYYLHTF